MATVNGFHFIERLDKELKHQEFDRLENEERTFELESVIEKQ